MAKESISSSSKPTPRRTTKRPSTVRNAASSFAPTSLCWNPTENSSFALNTSPTQAMKITTGDDYPDIMDSRLKGALDYVLDRIVNGPGGRAVADREARGANLSRHT